MHTEHCAQKTECLIIKQNRTIRTCKRIRSKKVSNVFVFSNGFFFVFCFFLLYKLCVVPLRRDNLWSRHLNEEHWSVSLLQQTLFLFLSACADKRCYSCPLMLLLSKRYDLFFCLSMCWHLICRAFLVNFAKTTAQIFYSSVAMATRRFSSAPCTAFVFHQNECVVMLPVCLMLRLPVVCCAHIFICLLCFTRSEESTINAWHAIPISAYNRWWWFLSALLLC